MASPKPKKFPPSPEIKRVLSAALSIGIEIGEVEIKPTRIRIRVPKLGDDRSPAEVAFDLWKASQAQSAGDKSR
jgi:hypothetical protein